MSKKPTNSRGRKTAKRSDKPKPALKAPRVPWCELVANPFEAATALPPVILGTPYVPHRLHHELLISTDENGGFGIMVTDSLAEHSITLTNPSDTGGFGIGTGSEHPDVSAQGLTTVFNKYIPLALAIKATYVGTADECSGTFYGAVTSDLSGYAYHGLLDLPGSASNPTGDGLVVSLTPGSNRWHNPVTMSSGTSAIDTAGGIVERVVLVGAGLPPSKTNCVRVEIVFHIGGQPDAGGFASANAKYSVPHGPTSDAGAMVAQLQSGASHPVDFFSNAKSYADTAARGLAGFLDFTQEWGPTLAAAGEYALPLLL